MSLHDDYIKLRKQHAEELNKKANEIVESVVNNATYDNLKPHLMNGQAMLFTSKDRPLCREISYIIGQGMKLTSGAQLDFNGYYRRSRGCEIVARWD